MHLLSCLRERVRRELRGSDLAYGIVSRFGAAHDVCRPHEGTKICVEGYPSSGNTFAMRLAKKVCASDAIASHAHAFGSVARARRMGIPTVLVVRKPQDTIASYCVRFGKEPAWAIREYIDFHQRVLRDTDDLSRLDFEVMVSEPHRAVLGLAARLGLPMTEDDARRLADAARAEIKVDRERAVETVGAASIGWPTAEKDAKKARVREALLADKKWARCEALYAQLIERLPSVIAE